MITPAEPSSVTDRRAALAASCWVIVAILAGFLCFTQLGMMVSLLAARAGIRLVAPGALLLALVLGDRLAAGSGLPDARRRGVLLVALGLVVAALAMSAWYFDLSWDGQWYHQTAIYAIARDWNPLTDPMRGFLSHLELWVRHYAKGPWYFAAAVYETTGQIEWGKAPAVLAAVVPGLAVLAAALDAGLPRRRAGAIAALVALNPVILSELTTFLVDGIMVGFLVAAVAALFSALRRPRPVVVWVGVLGSIVAINAKFTGLVFLSFAFAAGWGWCVVRQRNRVWGYTGWTALALGLGVFVFGYNPYVTNAVHRHQPFYPVLGSKAYPSLTEQGREGIIRFETPKNFLAHNRLVRFGLATFGRPGNAPYGGVRNAALMVPFTAGPDDLFFYRYHETRVAGFGPLFSGAFVLSFALGLWLLFQSGARRSVALVVVAAITGSLLISPHLWWARYGPQFWLLPVIPVLFVFAWPDGPRWARAVGWGLVALLAANAATVGAVRLTWETQATRTLRAQLADLRQPGREIEVSLRYFEIPVGERLKSWGIRFQPKGRNEIRSGTELKSVVDRYPGAVTYRIVSSAPSAAPAQPRAAP